MPFNFMPFFSAPPNNTPTCDQINFLTYAFPLKGVEAYRENKSNYVGWFRQEK